MLLDQLELALDELTASATEDELAAEKAAAGTTEVKGFVRRKPSRNPSPEHLPRERVVVPAPTSCACCGSERLSKIGEDVTETLEIIPRRWKVIQTVREKFTCRDCESISQPPAPFHAVPRGWAGPNLLATILFEKYGQHQSLNRQSKRYAKEGVDPRWLGGELGITMVLHTWGQNLGQHIHVHCIVTGGALSRTSKLDRALAQGIPVPNGRSLQGLPREVSRLPHRRPSQGRAAYARQRRSRRQPRLRMFEDLAATINETKALANPLPRPQSCGRRWRRESPPDRRAALIQIAAAMEHVRFRWRDYADGDKAKVMRLDADEFIRRFLLHVLPRGFTRLRHYGLLANRS